MRDVDFIVFYWWSALNDDLDTLSPNFIFLLLFSITIISQDSFLLLLTAYLLPSIPPTFVPSFISIFHQPTHPPSSLPFSLLPTLLPSSRSPSFLPSFLPPVLPPSYPSSFLPFSLLHSLLILFTSIITSSPLLLHHSFFQFYSPFPFLLFLPFILLFPPPLGIFWLSSSLFLFPGALSSAIISEKPNVSWDDVAGENLELDSRTF